MGGFKKGCKGRPCPHYSCIFKKVFLKRFMPNRFSSGIVPSAWFYQHLHTNEFFIQDVGKEWAFTLPTIFSRATCSEFFFLILAQLHALGVTTIKHFSFVVVHFVIWFSTVLFCFVLFCCVSFCCCCLFLERTSKHCCLISLFRSKLARELKEAKESFRESQRRLAHQSAVSRLKEVKSRRKYKNNNNNKKIFIIRSFIHELKQGRYTRIYKPRSFIHEPTYSLGALCRGRFILGTLERFSLECRK